MVTGVRHVLDVKRNLIYLGTLDARGYRYSSQGGALKVSKEAVTILKGEMFGGLYGLVGNVQMGVIVLKGEMFGGLYGLVGNVQMGGAAKGATTK